MPIRRHDAGDLARRRNATSHDLLSADVIPCTESDPTAVKMADYGAALYLVYTGKLESPKRKFLLRVIFCLFGGHTD
ncbi:hypothetical protein ABVT39_025104 [Epinephelus coioides]